MTIWRRLLGVIPVTQKVRAELWAEQNWPPPTHGDKSPDGRSTYLEGGPPNDPTPLWDGPFPPHCHIEPEPRAGIECTFVNGDLLRRGKIIAVQKPSRIVIRLEYVKRPDTFTLRREGCWRQRGTQGGTHLVLGIGASNFRSRKSWYSDADIRGGWII